MKRIIPEKYHEFIRFALVGATNTAVHAGIVIMIMEVFSPPAAMANAVAFIFANMISYVLNSRFTFGTPISFTGYRRFLMVSLVTLVLTLLITTAVEYAGLHYGVGLAMVILIVPVLNYLVMKIWAFAPAR